MPKAIPCEHNPKKRCDACARQLRLDRLKLDRLNNPEKFQKRKRAWYEANREHVKLYNRERHEANKEARHEYFNKRYAKYKRQLADKRRDSGLVWAPGQTFDGLMEKQGYQCAGNCGRDLRKLNSQQVHADHDHSIVGEPNVRGIVCHRCNMAAGMLGDTAAGVENLLNYLLNPPGFQHTPTASP